MLYLLDVNCIYSSRRKCYIDKKFMNALEFTSETQQVNSCYTVSTFTSLFPELYIYGKKTSNV
jgi:hypothetical protein